MTSLGFWLSIFFLAAIAITAVKADDNDEDAATKIMDGLFKKYDKRHRPYYRSKPVDVSMTIYVLDVFNIDEVKHEFTVNMYFRHHWEDPRLTFQPLPNMDKLLLDGEHVKKLWIPDTFMPNERKTVTHSVGSSQEMIRISPNGNVLRSIRISVTATCKMNLHYFPFDNQLCVLEMESYGYSASDLIYRWKEGQRSVGVSQEIGGNLKYRVTGISAKEATVTMESANYSRLGLEFFIVRNASRYMQDAYFPAILLAVLAMLTLYMDSLMARIQISMLLMGFMVVFMSLNSVWMPRVSYQTALDMYIFICASMIVNVVIVNFILHIYLKPVRKPSSVGMRRLEENGIEDNMKETLCDYESAGEPNLNTKFDEVIFHIAKKSKLLIPVSFLAINVIYWMVVLIGSSGFPEDFVLVEDRN